MRVIALAVTMTLAGVLALGLLDPVLRKLDQRGDGRVE